MDHAMTTGDLAAAAGYSVQQVRDLERLGVIPSAARCPNGYRRFGTEHVDALRAYRDLAAAVGPVEARSIMPEIRTVPHDDAVARIVALHTALARSRDDTLAALRALDDIVEEAAHDDPPAPGDALSITELARALGVRASALRFWEGEGLVRPERVGAHGARVYPPSAVRDARIVAALRAGGYRIPAARAVMSSIGSAHGTREARSALHDRLRAIAMQSEALLRVGAELLPLLPAPTDADG
ncbi:MerR family transcriptional regulator [Luteimicrobium album]|uniref:MerR family transcriptional regulator n=1 Tax=Luteimicrobium album TaxID=1054550 RepID=A0ABQ6I208_9MICO|nr:MerR family transcriptional regulator [Luteimicrobium album]GMA24286.1 MerR family transcriptional regulator [Luteimicrobium album]